MHRSVYETLTDPSPGELAAAFRRARPDSRRYLRPGPGLSPLGRAAGGHVPQSTHSTQYASSSSQYVTVPDNPALASQHLTLAAWVKFASPNTNAAIISKPAGPTWSAPYARYILRLDSTFLEGWVQAFGNNVNGGISLTANVWHHVTMTYDGSTLRLYVDGVPDNTASLSTAITASTEALLIGAPHTGDLAESWNGGLDDVLYYPDALTSMQIASLAAGTLNPATLDYSSGGGLWRVEEGTGTTTADASGNGNSGNLINGVTWSTDVPLQLQ